MLSVIYLSQGFVIYPHRQVIERGTETIQVRPKTFALLLLLLERPREILSKTFLLDSIWDDVKVEEQVLVQSVRELRQLFGDNEIIQTYPRKGYSWAAEVEKRDANSGEASPQDIDTRQPTQTQPAAIAHTQNAAQPRWKKVYSVLAIAAILVLSIGTTLLVKTIHSANDQTDVVLVLPLKNRLPGNDHNWVPLGAMDQLIHLLVSNKNVQVMGSDYVLGTMTHAHLPRDYKSTEVARVFGVSGATLVVEAELSGSVENYRLDYKLHFKNTIQRGAVFDRNLNIALHKLGEVVVSHTGQALQKNEATMQNIFNSELLARALEKRDAGEFALASSLFTSLKQLEPNNMTARIYLAQTLMRQGNFAQAIAELDSSITLAKAINSPELTHLYYSLAWINKLQSQPDDALKNLALADSAADQADNLLARATIADLRGDIAQNRHAFDIAQHSFEQALKFNTLIRCPIGISDMHLKLASLNSAQGKSELAQMHYRDAKTIIETHQLDAMRPVLDAVKLM